MQDHAAKLAIIGAGSVGATIAYAAARARRQHREHGHQLAPADPQRALLEIELMSVPRQTPLSRLREELGKLCDELNIDWRLATV